MLKAGQQKSICSCVWLIERDMIQLLYIAILVCICMQTIIMLINSTTGNMHFTLWIVLHVRTNSACWLLPWCIGKTYPRQTLVAFLNFKKARIVMPWHRCQDLFCLTTSLCSSLYTTLCPTLRLDLISYAVDCAFQTSTIHQACFAAIPCTTCAFIGYLPEIRNLSRVISCLISKLDRKSFVSSLVYILREVFWSGMLP